ncbi:MAG: Crp/Fnr family transcriptional regulator [Bacteroidia bacterium]|nr:Crp/Fnr family transcriptional regulator [Bacteroidia bacterium]
MSQLVALNEEEILAIEESFPIKTYPKGSFLLKEGQIAQDAFYVVKGCIRKYEVQHAEEKTLDFIVEEQSVVDFQSLTQRTPSNLFFECVEETTVAILNQDKENKLYKRFPHFETICRTNMESAMGARQAEFTRFITSTPEERYLFLLAERPGLLNRVPQYQLASYLGVKPETLSRIRRRITLKK